MLNIVIVAAWITLWIVICFAVVAAMGETGRGE